MRRRRDVAVAFAAAVLGAACQAGAPLLERQIVDGVIVEGNESLLPWLIALVVVAAGAFLAAHLRRYRGGKVALGVQYDLRNEMQAHLQRMDFTNLDRMPTGQLVARASSDTTLVQGLLMFIPMMSGNVLLMILSLGVMLWLSPPLALVSLIIAPALLARQLPDADENLPRHLGRPAEAKARSSRSSTRRSTASAWSRRSARSTASSNASPTPPRSSTARRCAPSG